MKTSKRVCHRVHPQEKHPAALIIPRLTPVYGDIDHRRIDMEVAGYTFTTPAHQFDADISTPTSSLVRDSPTSKSDSTPVSSPCHRPEEQRDIEHWTTDIINAFTACKFQHPVLDRLVPDFKSDREIIEGVECQPRTKAQYIEKHRLWAEHVPDRTMTVLHVVSDYDERRGKAEVWVWLNITGWGSARMCAESVSCFKWKRSQDVWWCHQHTGLRGAPPLQSSY